MTLSWIDLMKTGALSALAGCGAAVCERPPDVDDSLSHFEEDIRELWGAFGGMACVTTVGTREGIQGPGLDALGSYNTVTRSIWLTDELATKPWNDVSHVVLHELCHSANAQPQLGVYEPSTRTDVYQRPRMNVAEDAALWCAMGINALQWHADALMACGVDLPVRTQGLEAPLLDVFDPPDVIRSVSQSWDLAYLRSAEALFVDYYVTYEAHSRSLFVESVDFGLDDEGVVKRWWWSFESKDAGPAGDDHGDALRPYTLTPVQFRSSVEELKPSRIMAEGSDAPRFVHVDEVTALRFPDADYILCGHERETVFWVEEEQAAVLVGPERLRVLEF